MIRYNHVLLDDKLKWTSGDKKLSGVTLLRKDFVVRCICLCSALTEFNNNKIMFGNQVGI